MSGFELLAPLGIIAIISLPVIFLFHMKHSTPVRREVPTLRFWKQVAPVQSEDSRFRIPPLSLTLLLQLLAAAALAFGLAQPVIAGSLGGLTSRAAPVHLTVMIDGSTSMASIDTDDGRSRFESARRDALDNLDGLRQGDLATVIVLGTQNTTINATNTGEFKSMRDQLTSMPQPGGIIDLNAAFELVTDLSVPGMNEQISLFSDGAVSADPAVVQALPGTLTWNQYGRASSPNLAITEIIPKSKLGETNSLEIYLQIANFSANPVETVLVVQADGVEVDRQPMTVEPGHPADVTVRGLAISTRKVVAEVQSQDPLFIDNQATVVFTANGGADLSILLVSDLPGASQRALASIPNTTVETIGSAEFHDRSVPINPFDLIVFDGVLPPEGRVPNRPVLFIDPPRGGILPDGGMITIPSIDSIRADDPIMANVDLNGVTIQETPLFEMDAESVPVVASAEGPLIFRGIAPESGAPMVVVAFDLADSNLPNRIAFPILMANIVTNLSPSALPLTVPLGEPLSFSPRNQTASVEITDPLLNTTTFRVQASPADSASAVPGPDSPSVVTYTSTGTAGVYSVTEFDQSGSQLAVSQFSVNAGHPVESQLVANQELQSVLATQTAGSSGILGSRINELWPVLLVLALGLLIIEWLWSTVTMRPSRARSSSDLPEMT
jgi:Aerotolerance regulator N-terminal